MGKDITLLSNEAQLTFVSWAFCLGVQCPGMNERIKNIITGSDSHALATTGPRGLNVVPLSVVELRDHEIHLYDFFMGKTADNLQAGDEVALTSWKDFVGVQVKARVVYETDGEVFESAEVEMKERFPDRTLKAVIRLTPTAIYDVAPGAISDNLLE